jgi:hypothetical protein
LEFAVMSSCLRRLNAEYQTTIWHALLYAYIAVAFAPTVIDLLDMSTEIARYGVLP